LLLNHSGTIVDLHIHLLLETFELIDSKLAEIDEFIAKSENDSESEFERGEYFIGLGFVAIQQYLVETILLTKFDKSRAYTLGPKLPGDIPFVSLVNACANWWKHEPEWFNENELKDDAIRTIKRVQKFTDSNDFALSNVLAYLTNNGVRFTSLTPKIKEWSECIANSE
jgi:hypothetical protein